MNNYIFNENLVSDKETYIVYFNSKGVLGKFHIVNISISELHVQGISLPERLFKTFRKDRVLAQYSNIDELDSAVLSSFDTDGLSVKNLKPKSSGKLEICFTGFNKAEKIKLESTALNHDFLVKKDVTKSLSFLCCGYNAGPSKKEKARNNGALAITADQFNSLIDTGEIPEQGAYDLLSIDEDTAKQKENEIVDTFSTIRTMPRRQVLIANFINDYAVGWRFKVHTCHRQSLDIKLTNITYNGITKQVWTQGHAFNFIGGELIESNLIDGEPDVALQIKFTSPAGFDSVDTIDGEFTGAFRKNNASTEKGGYKVENFPIQFNSQVYDEGSLTVDVYIVENKKYTLKERVELSQAEFIALLQFGYVTKASKTDGLTTYNPFTL
jgi:hypothetical protein